jgi:nucleobase:cation symporter-1, NCS1 family
MATAEEVVRARPTVEIRSIDYVPLAERHGKVWHLGPFWFMGNAELTTLAVGLIGVSLGANLFWALAATVLGAGFGTFFMAFHSAQGPRLGLPQMIQSRPQFGYAGAILVIAFVVFNYAGFNVFNQLLAADALDNTISLPTKVGFFVISGGAFLIALFGYDWIHIVQRWLTYVFVVSFGIFTIGAIAVTDLPGGSLDPGEFSWTPFLIQFGVAASYQIGWAPYVSDYSRYLPPNVTVATTFWWTYIGSVIGAVWLMGLGNLVIAGNPDLGPIEAIRAIGDDVFDGFGVVILLLAIPGLVSVMSLNMYGGALALISAVDCFRPVRPTLMARVIGISLITASSLVVALIANENFLTDFNNFLLMLLYLFTPWTAINLVDYYIVRRGHYAIREIFNPAGLYGRWGWRGIVAYLIGFASEYPFMSTGWVTGPVADRLGGADISVFVGLPVSALVYLALTRSLDLSEERRIAVETQDELETEARAHYRPAEM